MVTSGPTWLLSMEKMNVVIAVLFIFVQEDILRTAASGGPFDQGVRQPEGQFFSLIYGKTYWGTQYWNVKLESEVNALLTCIEICRRHPKCEIFIIHKINGGRSICSFAKAGYRLQSTTTTDMVKMTGRPIGAKRSPNTKGKFYQKGNLTLDA